MVLEGIIINKNRDLLEVGILSKRTKSFVFIPEKFMDHFRLGQRLILTQGNATTDLTLFVG